tara:strand:- start:57 stop:158 length:102 start_codon:yes stop_codon:yes gene_type:complete
VNSQYLFIGIEMQKGPDFSGPFFDLVQIVVGTT